MHAPNISRILQTLMILFSTQTIQKLEYEQKKRTVVMREMAECDCEVKR